MNLLVISASLNPESNSRLLARAAESALATAGHTVAFADLRELALPPCDGAAAYGHPHTARAHALVTAATGIVIATPVYNYDVNASVKNLIELTGRAWEGKIVGFACAAGGTSSYMSIMGLANSLMLDFRCTIVPRFVYATEADFAGDAIANVTLAQRTEELALTVARYAQALQI